MKTVLIGRGSLQQYIHYDVEYHYFNFTPEDKELLKPVMLFDLLVNNADRKGSHVFFENDTHKLYAIDHGVCFHEENKLRTVIWDFAGQAIPDELLAPLSQTDSWSSLFESYLSPEEIAALKHRAKKLLTSKYFRAPRVIGGRFHIHRYKNMSCEEGALASDRRISH